MFETQSFVSVKKFCCLGKGGSAHSGGPHVGDQQQEDHHFASMDLLYRQGSDNQQRQNTNRNQHQKFKGIFRNIKREELTTKARHEVVYGKCE
jgi:hypothetical protein